MTPKAKAAGLGTRTAFKTAHETHHSAQPIGEQGKAAAMFLYNVGAASFQATQAKFARNPEWRSA